MNSRLQRTRHVRSQILWAAAEAFRKKGYHATSVADIARELGLAKPTLYHYFKSKQELLFDSHLLAAAAVVEDLRAIRQRSESAEVRLRQAVLAFMVAVVEKVPLSSVLVFQDSILSVSQRRKIIEIRDEADRIFRSIISDGIDSGDFIPVDPKIVSLVIIGAMNWLPHWYSHRGALSIHDLGHRFADYLIRGLARSEGTRAHMAASGAEDEAVVLGLTVAVLGAGSTLGQAVALDLGRGGARVVAVDGSETAARRLVAEIRRLGAEAESDVASLGDAAQCEAAVGRAATHFGHLDAVVDVHDLCAALAAPLLGPHGGHELYVPMIETAAAARAAQHVLEKEGRGSLLFVVRTMAPDGGPEDLQVEADASRAWFAGFTRALTRDLASSGVRVNTILATTRGGEPDARLLHGLLGAVRLLLSRGGHVLTGQVIRLADPVVGPSVVPGGEAWDNTDNPLTRQAAAGDQAATESESG